ncbi:hypothetical protein SO802_033063 [Lithocarpus litseifolius]|uniref:Uncharacterized protein n=1 Tax=Lithocarpus litseifolius TaxID=425828 RepID=A0AAW2BDR6_9ROSI
MGNRRFAQISTSDEDEEAPRRPSEEGPPRRKRLKRIKLPQEEAEPKEEPPQQTKNKNNKSNKKEKEKEKEPSQSSSEEEPPQEDAKAIGDSIRLSGKGRGRRSHYEAFEFDGNRYDLEDPVLLVPEEKEQKPYVAIIKDIAQTKDGSIMVTGQWFYRPEEAERKGGGNWQSRDTRELFYSFHRDEVPAESVMHKCVVHFVPIHKQLPSRKQHPGFIVQKVYDTVERKLWKLTDKDYEDNKQHEIDLLVQKTMSRLGDLPDIETDDAAAVAGAGAGAPAGAGPAAAAAAAATVDQEDQLKAKRSLRRKNISPLDVSRDEEATRPDQHLRAETPGSGPITGSVHYSILANFKALIGDNYRDRWLERLLIGIQYMCNSVDSMHGDDKEKGRHDGISQLSENKCQETANGTQAKSAKSCKSFLWPDAAVLAVTALEKAAHETLSSDFQKYNQKLRQLVFNLKNNEVLARRLLNGDLEPSKILNMSPSELKEGLTAEETATKEPDESERMQMTDARCSRCSEFKVGVRDIIQAGHGDRYQLECIACGHSWYASRDEASMLTIDAPNTSKAVGTAPWATAKFEDVEKKLVSPREPDKAAIDVFKKTSEAYMPVLDTQKSFGRPKKEEKSESARNAE